MTIFRSSRTKLTFVMEQCQPYNKERLNEQLIYLDGRTVRKVAPAECSEIFKEAILLSNTTTLAT